MFIPDLSVLFVGQLTCFNFGIKQDTCPNPGTTLSK